MNRRPKPRDVFTSESIERGDDIREVSNKVSIKVPKAKEGFDVFDVLWDGPGEDAVKLGRVHGDQIMGDDDTEKVDFRCREDAFFKFDEKMVIEEDFEDKEDASFEFFI